MSCDRCSNHVHSNQDLARKIIELCRRDHIELLMPRLLSQDFVQVDLPTPSVLDAQGRRFAFTSQGDVVEWFEDGSGPWAVVELRRSAAAREVLLHLLAQVSNEVLAKKEPPAPVIPLPRQVHSFMCPMCGTSHRRGYYNGAVDVFRCLNCGHVGPNDDALYVARTLQGSLKATYGMEIAGAGAMFKVAFTRDGQKRWFNVLVVEEASSDERLAV
jgi:predicted RNA-binding Zn-ribbon protein involved in translation (DUF1610 family)